MLPALWGPNIWFMLHLFAYSFQPSKANIDAFKAFLVNLPALLPCYECARDFKAILNKYDIDAYMTDQERLWELSVMLHNDVNVKLGKPVYGIMQAKSEFVKRFFDASIKSSTKCASCG